MTTLADPLAPTQLAAFARRAQHDVTDQPACWPAGVTSFVARVNVDAGWTYRVVESRGLTEVSRLAEQPRADGTRERIEGVAECDSYRVTVRHEPLGLHAFAVWIRPEGRNWSCDMAELVSVCTDPACRRCLELGRSAVVHALAWPTAILLTNLAAIVNHEPSELM